MLNLGLISSLNHMNPRLWAYSIKFLIFGQQSSLVVSKLKAMPGSIPAPNSGSF
jgi:hypothetical protein